MLDRLRVKNFRLLREVEIAFETDLPTVLIGPNASGKSTVLEVLDFLSRCAQDGLGEAVLAHGGFSSLCTAGTRGPIEIETSWTAVPKDGAPLRFEWKLSLVAGPGGGTLVSHESLIKSEGEKTVPLVSTPSGRSREVFWKDNDGPPTTIREWTDLAFNSLRDPDRFPDLGLFGFFVRQLSVIANIATASNWTRIDSSGPSPRDSLVIAPVNKLGRQGNGLANVLYSLQTDREDAWKELEGAFRAEFPFVKRIVFPPDPGGAKIAFGIEDRRFTGRKMLASELSDGMISLLCLLAAIVTARAGAIGLDEPDANIHPSALRRLMSLAAVTQNRRLVIVTHSNALLEELVEPARSIRIVEPTEGGAKIRTLDSAALDEWRKEYTLSAMRATGLLDQPNTLGGEG